MPNSIKNDNPALVLENLLEGNERFVSGLRLNRDLLGEVKAHANGQAPDAVILSCIDSRGPVEIIFDQGIGDIFTIRIAGNIVNNDILGSLEFACGAKGSKVLMVLGHTSCGAIEGACNHVELGNLTGLLHKIQPAIDEYESSSVKAENKVDAVAKINVKKMLEFIRSNSPIIKELDEAKKIVMVGAMYDLETGKVTVI